MTEGIRGRSSVSSWHTNRHDGYRDTERKCTKRRERERKRERAKRREEDMLDFNNISSKRVFLIGH